MIKGGITIEVYKRVAAAAAALERVVFFPQCQGQNSKESQIEVQEPMR